MQKDLEQIKTYMDQIKAAERNLPQSFDDAAMKHGLIISRQATTHPKEVAMTPLMKNLLRKFGDIGEGERLMTGAPTTRAERWLHDTCKQLLLEQSKTVRESYNTQLPLRSVDHYYTDCFLNLNEKKWRDIQPGQVEEINEMIKTYASPTGSVRVSLDNPVFAKAVQVVLDQLPRVSATRKITEVNLPFMTKHTNVGYPYFANDRTTVPGANMTYAQLTMREAEQHMDDISWLYKNNVTEEFSRYQRGKGRLIQAVSRRVNLVLNQLESVEIANYKTHSPLFAGYNDASHLKQVLTEMMLFSEANGYDMYNLDYHRYDAHVSKYWLELIGAMSMLKCADKRSAEFAKARAALMTQTTLVAGTLDKVLKVFGRIFSGFIDTNRAGGCINATNMTYLVMKQDPHYVRDIVSRVLHYMVVMGDDVNLIMKHGTSLVQLQREASDECGFEIDDASKIAYGPMFLQYRLFEYDGKLVMIYPWPRVMRSMMFKERPKGLGPCGWTLAFYQQLAKLKECPTFLAPPVNIAAVADDNRLMLDVPVKDIISGAAAEDAEASKKGKRITSTSEALYDGDPSKAEQFDSNGNLKPSYFEEVQHAIQQVYDPNYLSKHGISVPK